jgi:peptide-methionine (R)-S-oxide reductase
VKNLLDPEQFQRVPSQSATERPFSGKYNGTKARRRLPLRLLQCSRCSIPDAKFDSGCGWPSFFRAG